MTQTFESEIVKPQALWIDFDGTIVPAAEEVHRMSVMNTIISALVNTDNHELFQDTNFNTVWNRELGKGIVNFYEQYLIDSSIELQSALKTGFRSAAHFERLYENSYLALADEAAEHQEEGLALPKGLADKFAVRSGMKKLIHESRDAGIKVGIISNAKRRILEANVAAVGLSNSVDIVLGYDDFVRAGYKPKPHGGAYAMPCDFLRVDPAKCVGFEDTGTGLRALNSAGIGNIVFCSVKEDEKTPSGEDIRIDNHLSVQDNVYDVLAPKLGLKMA